jgi:hypothetical protein
MGEHMHPEVSMHTHPLGRYMAHIRSGDWDAVADLMLSSACKLADIGADVAICPDNTIHQAFARVAANSPIDLRRQAVEGQRIMAMQNYVNELRSVIKRGTPALLTLSEADSARHPAPGAWSPREVLGHLIDSASNNHQRFVRAQFQDDLVFPGYEQDGWVTLQQYQESPWVELVALWRAFNLHLARVMAVVPEPVRARVHYRHNLDEIAWQTVAPGAPTTLDYLMGDYVEHVKHHFRQILGSRWESPATTV